MPVTPSWQEIDAAFVRAANLEGEARAAFLDSLADATLRREVEALLEADGDAAGLLTGLVGDAAAALDDVDTLEFVGAWKILRPLAAGGMGTVYLAEREGEGFRQKAALKLLRRGFDSRFFVSRFRQERRILASLEHPHIAHLLDGGTAADGRPYLALEFVDGQSITSYCAELPQEQRVRLFLDVCFAVDHAHQRMVIHRDIKPSNILVNREGQVKLLDFGIAKMLDAGSSDESVALTGTGVKLMTPEYAAPEQVRGGTITAATDVYCLGLVLYEVLTGRKPLALPADAPLEAARLICEQEPAATGLPPDLDAVVRKCLRKEPSSRYSVVAGLSADLERVLRGDAVSAYRGAFSYRAGKWLRRYRWGVAAAVLVLLAVGGGVFATARQARIAQKRYEDVRRLARTVIFDVYDQVEMLPAATKARETIVNTALEYLQGLSVDARDDPGLAMELAAAYVKVGDVLGYPRMPNLGRLKEAVGSFQKARTLYNSVAVQQPGRPGVRRGLARISARMAAVANNQQQLDEAMRLVEEAERLERQESAGDANRDWDLLVHLDYERVVAAGFREDAADHRSRLAELGRDAAELYRIRPDENSRYWISLVRRQTILSNAFSGEPSLAFQQLLPELAVMKREVSAENIHPWLKSDLLYYNANLTYFLSGLTFPSAGRPADAVRVADGGGVVPSTIQSSDRADLRLRVHDLMRRCGVLPARAFLDAKAALGEFVAIRQAMDELKRSGNSDAFDDVDYLQLAVGGVRSLRLLGRKDEAAIEAVKGLAQLESLKEDAKSPQVVHCENVLRFEQALLGIDIQTAVQRARLVQLFWPFALLLKGDVIKILSISGERTEAQKVLESLPACEYHRRLEQEFKSNKFLD